MEDFHLSLLEIEKFRYKFISNTDQSYVLEKMLPFITEKYTHDIRKILETMCGITAGLITYAFCEVNILNINTNGTLEDIKRNKFGLYHVDYISKYDHTFILIVNDNISTIIQSYENEHYIHSNDYDTNELISMLENIPSYYNKLFHVNKPYVSEYKLDITILTPRGNVLSNLLNMPYNEKWISYTNDQLRKYNVQIINDQMYQTYLV